MNKENKINIPYRDSGNGNKEIIRTRLLGEILLSYGGFMTTRQLLDRANEVLKKSRERELTTKEIGASIRAMYYSTCYDIEIEYLRNGKRQFMVRTILTKNESIERRKKGLPTYGHTPTFKSSVKHLREVQELSFIEIIEKGFTLDDVFDYIDKKRATFKGRGYRKEDVKPCRNISPPPRHSFECRYM